MKKVITLIFLFGFFVSVVQSFDIKTKDCEKTILIMTCKGGGGHLMAANSINEILKKKNYNPKIVNPFCDPEIFGSIDFTKKITFNTCACEDVYNTLLRYRFNWLINKLSDFGMKWMKSHNKTLKKIMSQYLTKNKPDMIISVIPYFNNIILEVAEELNLPFLAIPTDLNTSTFAFGMQSPKYKKFIFSLAFDDPMLLDQIKSFNIPKENLRFIGYPLRKQFFEVKDKQKIKKEFNIPDDKTVVMILMGAEGSSAIYTYVYNLSKSKLPLHLIICVGRTEALKAKINKIKLPKHITKTIFGFTDRISDLMTSSDLLITKPGSHSFCEALQIGVPIILDQTNTSLYWEKINGDIIKKYNLGDVIKSYRKINTIVEKIVNNEKLKKEIKTNLQKFKRESFEKPLVNMVEEMLKNEGNNVTSPNNCK